MFYIPLVKKKLVNFAVVPVYYVCHHKHCTYVHGHVIAIVYRWSAEQLKSLQSKYAIESSKWRVVLGDTIFISVHGLLLWARSYSV